MQAYCLAFGPHGAEDVTRVYVDDWDACLARRADKNAQGTGWSEKRLKWVRCDVWEGRDWLTAASAATHCAVPRIP